VGQDDPESINFLGFLDTMRGFTEKFSEEIRATRNTLIRPIKRRKVEEVELDFSTFPLTYDMPFDLKDPKAMPTVLQKIFAKFKSTRLICTENGEMFEMQTRNAITYLTPDYEKGTIPTEYLSVTFSNHMSRHLLERTHCDTCIFCRYDFCCDLRGFPEFNPFFEKVAQCLSCKSAKCLFSDVVGLNSNRAIDKALCAFQNVYFDIVKCEFMSISLAEGCGRIAVCNHTDKVIPETFILNESSLKSENFFELYKWMIPVFNSCLGQTEDVTQVMLADIGSGFIPRGVHDSYQKASFFLGPGGKGKSEFQKILRCIHGDHNCITPCSKTLGEKFSHAQYTGSLAVAYLPDEIHKKCGLSQQMLYNFIDQTPIRCELKFKQKLLMLPFQLGIYWVANGFFPDYELTEALLRRLIVYDVNLFVFKKFSSTPSSLIKKCEVRRFLPKFNLKFSW